MVYRFNDIEVPEIDPFKHDALDRKDTVTFLADLIKRAGDKGPFVFAIDAPYGSGKSTVVALLRAVLATRKFYSVQLNAWQVDSSTDPLIPLVSVLDEAMNDLGSDTSVVAVAMKKVRSAAGAVIKRGAFAAAKIATLGALDVEKEYEAVAAALAGDLTTDLIAEFQKEQASAKLFRQELGRIVELLPEMEKEKTLVFFIDELDRCRPDFAISLLERIKHMFDIDNVVFVLSIDKKQLAAVTAAVYGSRIDATEYLRKFIDLEFGLPRPSSKKFVEMCIKKADIDQLFMQKRDRSTVDREHFVRFFTAIADARGLSLRTQERCITRLRVVVEQTPDNEGTQPVLLALLIILRAVDETLFYKFARGFAYKNELLKFFHAEDDGPLSNQDRAIILGCIIGELPRSNRESELEVYDKVMEDPHATREAHHFAQLVVDMARYRSNRSVDEVSTVAKVAQRVDMAANIRN